MDLIRGVMCVDLCELHRERLNLMMSSNKGGGGGGWCRRDVRSRVQTLVRKGLNLRQLTIHNTIGHTVVDRFIGHSKTVKQKVAFHSIF